MKKVNVTLIINALGRPTIPELGIDIGYLIDGSNVLKGHGLDTSEIRGEEEALHIGKQIVDAINLAGGIEITDLEYEYRFGSCVPCRESWDCNCGRFNHLK